MLSRLSDDAFPEPTTITNRRPDGEADLIIESKAHENRKALNDIYGWCGDRIHPGSLKSLLKAGGKRYDFGEIAKWKNFLVKLLNTHAVLMPDRKNVMVVFMRNDPDGDVNCKFLPISREGDDHIALHDITEDRPL